MPRKRASKLVLKRELTSENIMDAIGYYLSHHMRGKNADLIKRSPQFAIKIQCVKQKLIGGKPGATVAIAELYVPDDEKENA